MEMWKRIGSAGLETGWDRKENRIGSRIGLDRR